MRQHVKPVVIKNGEVKQVREINLNSKEYNEVWVQELCFNNPSILPINEIEPVFGGSVPICMELGTESGYADLIFINEYGMITIGECKLWRNSEARRAVISQILEYAKDLSKWDYNRFESACLRARKKDKKSLVELMKEYYPDLRESEFIDRVQTNLRMGRFFLAVIGDGIRENAEELTTFINAYGNLRFSLGLIELPVFETETGEQIITPRVIARTHEIERLVFTVADNHTIEAAKPKAANVSTVSEEVFYERLEQSVGKSKAEELKMFLSELNTDLSINGMLGTGKNPAMNIKTGDNRFNLASVQDNGEIWFYGVVTKTDELGNSQIGIDYLKNLAEASGGDFYDGYKEYYWGIKKEGKLINIKELLPVKNRWKDLIAEFIRSTEELENN